MRPRRRRREADSLDSLLDTMANVVGILVVVLAVVQLHVGDAMDRIRDLVRSEAAALRSEEAALATQWLTLAPENRNTTRELARLAVHRDALPEAWEPARTEQARELERGLRAHRAQLADLRVELEVRERRDSEPFARSVRLPDPRPAPPRSTPLLFLVRHGRVLHADIKALEQTMLAHVRAVGARSGDPARVAALFEAEDIGDANLRWRLYRGRGGLMAQLRWRGRERGDAQADLSDARSPFRRALRAASPRQRYALFHVWGDSFATYLSARRQAEARGFSVGWVPHDVAEEYEGLLVGPREPIRDNPVPVD